MSEIKLKECPFCGEELEVVGKGHYFAHKINGCILQHLCFDIDNQEAIEQWNTRKPMDRIVERLEQYQQEYSSGDGEFTDELVDRVLRNAIEIVKAGGVDDTRN